MHRIPALPLCGGTGAFVSRNCVRMNDLPVSYCLAGSGASLSMQLSRDDSRHGIAGPYVNPHSGMSILAKDAKAMMWHKRRAED